MRVLKRVLLVVVVLAVVGGGVFYLRPLWVQRQEVHFGLFTARVQSNYVLTPEGRAHYYEAEATIPGGGIPLVLVHGLADRDESWAPMLKRLKAEGFHVYAPDLLGYGRSPRPADSDYSIATQEKFVADFIQALGLQRPNIGGWSMGGWITLKLALDHPEMVDRVIVYDSAGILFEHTETADVFHPTDMAGINRLLALFAPDAQHLPEFAKRDFLRTMMRNSWVVDRSVASMVKGDDLLDGRLKDMTRPLLIVWGSDDRLTPVSTGVKMHALAPASTLDIVEGCGHLAPATCSARTALATASFLKANPAPVGEVRRLAAN